MAQVFDYLKDSAGNRLNARVKTASFNSEPISPAGMSMIGLLVKVPTPSGTSPSLTIKLQRSHDGGVTWWDTYAAAENSQTQAAMTAITAAIETEEHWPVWSGGPSKAKDELRPMLRFVFTITGTSPSFTITAIVEGRDY